MPVTQLKVLSENWLSKTTFRRRLSDVPYTLAHVFTFESELSQRENSIPESELWFTSQKHVTLLTSVLWS